MDISVKMQNALSAAYTLAQLRHSEYVCPEHVLYIMLHHHSLNVACHVCGVSIDDMIHELDAWFSRQEEALESGTPELSYQYNEMVDRLYDLSLVNINTQLDEPQFLKVIYDLEDSEASYVLHQYVGDKMEAFLVSVGLQGSDSDSDEDNDGDLVEDDLPWDSDDDDFDDNPLQMLEDWHKYATCINDHLDSHNPLIGRQEELDRTLEVLCRKEKNNPLHIGEPGVGKTSLIYGLAARIEEGRVPDRLKGFKIYSVDMGSLLAGAQYRGDFEKRLKSVMEGLKHEGNAIVYLDEIHTIMGAGSTNEGGPDAANLLKPYLEDGELRFIGSTTYEEYNRHIATSKGIARRFQQIDVPEPSVEETIGILRGLQKRYEQFHHVVYRADAIEYAVKAAAKYISNRCLPDKAIDLIDEAGAYLELHPNPRTMQYVTRGLVKQVLEKVCKVKAAALKDSGGQQLKSLRTRMSQKIYGQDEAVGKVVEAVEMARAGLTDDNKPMASLLFVGPTGVGKTEVARVLAKELGVELVRFDMSEYSEKHTVAKLIGSPAGYVGYDDGGLLTDAIRKSPNCVLLLDEIEKAHSDIYNLLLQVMDYARLTDNKGQKADFRQVVLIMTSNAGAQFASQASVGFANSTTRGDAMMKQVRRTFKPEFLNRLSSVVVFNDMTPSMARLILKKKLGEVQARLLRRKVVLSLSPEAEKQLLKLGFSAEYGAREMDRVIERHVKRLLVHEMLYGQLVNGGKVVLTFDGKTFALKMGRSLPHYRQASSGKALPKDKEQG